VKERLPRKGVKKLVRGITKGKNLGGGEGTPRKKGGEKNNFHKSRGENRGVGGGEAGRTPLRSHRGKIDSSLGKEGPKTSGHQNRKHPLRKDLATTRKVFNSKGRRKKVGLDSGREREGFNGFHGKYSTT